MSRFKVLYNGRVVTSDSIINSGEIVIEGAIVRVIGTEGTARNFFLKEKKKCTPPEIKYINANSCIISPGFIDLHVHGGGGADFMDASPSAIQRILDTHSHYGTTSLLATTLAADWFLLHEVAERLERYGSETEDESFRNAAVLGLHLEGPYLNKEYAGAQPLDCIKKPRIEEVESFIEEHGNLVKMVTLAPELPGSEILIEYLNSKGIIVAAGHSGASWEDIARARAKGLSHITHFFNAMRCLHHREPGLVGAALFYDDLSLELIADGFHLSPDLVKLLFKYVDHSRLVLVTDAIRACDQPGGEYTLGTQKIYTHEEVPQFKNGKLAGSVLTLNKALINVMNWTGLSFRETVKMVTINPARAIKIEERKGSLETGKDADLLILDNDFNVLLTMVRGEVVFDRSILP